MSIYGAAENGTFVHKQFLYRVTDDIATAEQVYANDPQLLLSRLKYNNDYTELANGVRDLIVNSIKNLQP